MSKLSERNIQILLFICAFLAYANTIGHDYVWDDSIVITENHRIKKGLSGIPDLFLKYNSEYKSDKYGYRPIVLSSFAIDYSLAKDSPHFGHFMNVLYFSLLCLVIYRVLRKLFYKHSNLAPFLITLLFLIHPVHVEVVANIKSRDEIFALLFSLLSLNSLITYHHSSKIKTLLFSLFLFLLAYLCKESSITFLAIMPLTLLYLGKRPSLKKLFLPSISIFILLLICIGIYTLYTGSTLGKSLSAGAGIYYENGILGNSFFHTDRFMMKLANALSILVLYLKNFFFPTSQLYYYGYNQIPVANFGQIGVILSVFIHLGLLLFAVIKINRYREISYGILFYFISISVYTHLVITLADTMSDRFLFTPSLGLCILVVFVLGTLLKIDLKSTSVEDLFNFGKNKIKSAQLGKASINKLRSIFLILFILLGIKTYTRNRVWKDNWTLISSDMPKLENCARAHNFYADLLKTKLKTKYDSNIEAEMISHYKRSFEISKESYYAYLGLGTYLCDANKFDEGISVLDTMIRIYPEQADPNYYLGTALYQTGKIRQALFHLKKSLILAPAVLQTYYFLSLAYSKNGEYNKAIVIINMAKQKFSESSIIYDAYANIYFDKDDLTLSTKSTLEMLRFGENPELVYGKIIGRYQVKKQDSLAAFYYKEAIARGIFKR